MNGLCIPDDLPVLARLKALPHFAGDETLLNEMLRYFADSGNDNLDRLNMAITEKDHAVWMSVAHRIKGEAVTLGLERINAAAARLEAAGRERDCASAREIMPILEQEIQALREVLKE